MLHVYGPGARSPWACGPRSLGGNVADVSVPRRRARRRYWWWIALIVVALAVTAVFVLRRGSPPAQRVFLERVEKDVFVREVSGTGTVEPVRSLLLTFPGAGTVARIDVAEGQRVEAGAELARLDGRAIERDLSSSRASLLSARAELERVVAQQAVDRLDAQTSLNAAENRLASAQQALVDAEQQQVAAERLFLAGGASQNERDAAVSALAEAARQVDQATLARDAARGRLQGLDALAQAQVKSGEASMARLETTLANLDQQIAETALVAPFAGVIARLPFKVGDRVAPGAQQGIELVDDTSVHVVADVDENRSVDLAVGQTATITPDAAPDLALPAVVTRVDPVAARGEATARLRAELAFAPAAGETIPTAAVRPGYTVTVRVVVHRIPDALLVPLEAVQEGSDGTSYVFRVNADGVGRGVAKRVDVQVLDRSATLAAVAAVGGKPAGLESGDSIAVTNVDVLQDGQVVSFEVPGGGG